MRGRDLEREMYEEDELESIAFSNGYNNKVQRSSSQGRNVGWDFHNNTNNNNLGVFNADMSHFHYMERFEEEEEEYSLVDYEYDQFSTGYLQDVLFEFTSKRRKLTSSPSSIKNCWTSNLIQNFNTQMAAKCDAVSESKRGEEEEEEEEVWETNNNEESSSIMSMSSHENEKEWTTPEKGNLYCTIDPPIFSSGCRNDKRKKRVVAKVVYPFALVKPGGFEGDVTINDINERILMPPTRPVRHPVGDFACRPLVSPDGPGLSGKAVVAFTRIHTQGRGTITIIRTRG